MFFVPALAEETAFRGVLAPDRTETSRPLAAIAAATVVFTGWHVGAGCAVMRWRPASVWPGVGLHWLVVAVWRTWLGGPGVTALK